MLAYCLAKPGSWADNPWEHDHPVVKVSEAGKIFAFLAATGVGVKCGSGRDEADQWLARFPQEASVMAHIGRSGWNDLRFGGAIDDDELLAAVHDSYLLVVSGLPKRHRPDGWDA